MYHSLFGLPTIIKLRILYWSRRLTLYKTIFILLESIAIDRRINNFVVCSLHYFIKHNENFVLKYCNERMTSLREVIFFNMPKINYVIVYKMNID